MTACEILALARSRGVEVTAASDGALRWRCRGPLPDDLRRLLSQHKSDLLRLLDQPGKDIPGTPFPEGQRVLADLRAAVARLRAACPGGEFPPRTDAVVRLWLEVCESYVTNHELEARRGWSALVLLRRASARCLEAASRWGDRPHARSPARQQPADAAHVPIVKGTLSAPLDDADAEEVAAERAAIQWESSLTDEEQAAVLAAEVATWDAVVRQDGGGGTTAATSPMGRPMMPAPSVSPLRLLQRRPIG